MTVTITSKINNQFDTRIASLEEFGNQQVWEDDGSHSYAYDLNVVPGIKLTGVTAGGVKTRIDWKPNGDDRCFFNYRLVLRFSNGQEIQQTNPALVELSENIRTYTNP